MGASLSVDLRPEEVRELEDATTRASDAAPRAARARRRRAAAPALRVSALPLTTRGAAGRASRRWRILQSPPSPAPTCRAVAPKQIKSLYKRFRRLDRSNRGTIATDDLLMIPELSMNPLAPRLVTLFERDGEDRINFRAFVAGLAVFSDRCRPEVRQRLVFRVFDCDGDGFIGREDLTKVLALMVGKTMSATAIETTVSRTLSDCDVDRDGRISFADFDASLSGVVAWDLFHVPLSSAHRWEAETAGGMTSPHSFAKLSAAAGGGGVGGDGGTGAGAGPHHE